MLLLLFTSHYVSIKSIIHLIAVQHHSNFTSHYVSIKSNALKRLKEYRQSLHPIMFLLNRKCMCVECAEASTLHPIMFLLNPHTNIIPYFFLLSTPFLSTHAKISKKSIINYIFFLHNTAHHI